MSTEKLLFKMRGIISCLSTNGNHPIEEKKLKKKAGFNARAKVLHSQLALVVKNLPADTYRHKRCRFNLWVGKIPWRRKWQTHFSILVWRIPWTEEPGKLQSIGSQGVRHD